MSTSRILMFGLLLSAAISTSGEATVPKGRPSSALAADGRPNVFGSVALPLKHTRYDARWQRVLRSASRASLAPLIRPARALGPMDQLQYVNSSLNQRIRYRYDANASGDYWATASETLSKSSGDCEDFVIAKMQALRALGVAGDALYMTIGNDVAAGAVHAVLLVRTGSQFWVLDNRTNRLIPQQSYSDFYPILTFGSNSAWLHGYKRGQTPAAVKRLSLAFNGARELPLGNSKGSALPSRSLRASR